MAKKKKRTRRVIPSRTRLEKTIQKLQADVDKMAGDVSDWRRAYEKEHSTLLRVGDRIRIFEEERLKFLEDWYDLSSDILAEQKTRNHKARKEWTVTFNTPENMEDNRNETKES